jgi:phosphoglycerate dehydrogenase-like enzyme
MLRVAILDDYQRVALDMADWSVLGPDVEIAAFDEHLKTPDEAAHALAEFDVICLMRERMPVPRTLIERLPNLKLIMMTGSQSQSIDFEACAARGIPVCRTSPHSSPAAAELTWALVLACARHFGRELRGMRDGRWQTTVGIGLHGKTLGLLGLGTLGAIVASYGRAFGMRVIAWSANLTAERATSVGAVKVSRDELLATSDIVSIHLKLSARTRGLIGAAELARMKPSAILVNTSRGPIVDDAALVAALRNKQIGGAGLDVFDQEPLPSGHPLRQFDNVVLTPHLGYVTDETYRQFYTGVVDGIVAWRAGAPVHQYRGAATG